MATRYDPAIIQKFADRLYRQANLIIFIWTILGLVGGAGAGYALGSSFGKPDTRNMFIFVGAAVLGPFGFLIGMARAFLLKLQAQIALCQKKIEENTRP